jgi:hypothetical protein
MGFLSRLFGRVQEEPVARPPEREPEPEREPRPDPELEPTPQPEPESLEPPEPPESVGTGLVPSTDHLEPEPEPVGAGLVPPAADRELEPEPESVESGPPSELTMTLEEAVAALRAAGSDGVRIGFLSREYRRAAEDDGVAARRKLVAVLTDELRSRGLLAENGRFELQS